MSEEQPYESLSLPYVCVDCGAPMRTKGEDMRCSRCLAPFPRVTCRGYTDARDRHVSCSHVIQQGDPGGEQLEGLCILCKEMQSQSTAIRTARKAREVERWAGDGHDVSALTDEDWEVLTRGQ